MNRNLMIAIAAVVLVVILAVGSFFFLGNKKNKAVKEPPKLQEAVGSNSISSIAEALSKSMSLKCEYTTPDGTKTVAYVKNGMIRSDVTGKVDQQSGSAIIKDNKVYFWNDVSAYVINVPDAPQATSKNQGPSTGGMTTVQALEQYKNYCKEAAVPNSLFELPRGVDFLDANMIMPSGAQKVPTGGAQPQPSAGQMEDLIKKYQQTQ